MDACVSSAAFWLAAGVMFLSVFALGYGVGGYVATRAHLRELRKFFPPDDR